MGLNIFLYFPAKPYKTTILFSASPDALPQKQPHFAGGGKTAPLSKGLQSEAKKKFGDCLDPCNM